MSLIPMRWPVTLSSRKFTCQITVYKDDGTLSVVHGGIEIGQGINTKVAQVVAKFMKVSLDDIVVKETNNFVAQDNTNTGGSKGSDGCMLVRTHYTEKITNEVKLVLQVK